MQMFASFFAFVGIIMGRTQPIRITIIKKCPKLPGVYKRDSNPNKLTNPLVNALTFLQHIFLSICACRHARAGLFLAERLAPPGQVQPREGRIHHLLQLRGQDGHLLPLLPQGRQQRLLQIHARQDTRGHPLHRGRRDARTVSSLRRHQRG